MSYVLPEFNLAVNIWHWPTIPPAPPDLVTIGNLAFSRRVHNVTSNTPPFGAGTSASYLLVPALTDVRNGINGHAQPDALEIPAGSGRYYLAGAIEDVGKGFPNEHRVIFAVQTIDFGPWPVPIP